MNYAVPTSSSVVSGPDNQPVWGSSAARPSFAPLDGDTEADLCVVGLGGSGLACIMEWLSLELTATRRIIGIDAGTVGGGAAGRNGGFLLAGLAMFYHDAVARLGQRRASALYAATRSWIEVMRCETPEAIRLTGSLRIATSPEELADCALHMKALDADGFPVEAYDGPEGRGLLFPGDGVFDPLTRCRLLASRADARGVRLHEHTPATRVASGMVETPRGRIRASKIVVAVDGKLELLVPQLAGRVRTARLQMLATAPAPEVRFPRPVYARYGLDYWQQLPDGRVVLGGFRDRGGDAEWTTDTTPTAVVQDALDALLRDRLGVRAAVTHRWAASVAYTTSGLPILEEVAPGVIVVGGYSGTGNVVGAFAGRTAARSALVGQSLQSALIADGARP